MGSGQGQPTWALHIPSKLLYYTSKKQNGGYFCLRLYKDQFILTHMVYYVYEIWEAISERLNKSNVSSTLIYRTVDQNNLQDITLWVSNFSNVSNMTVWNPFSWKMSIGYSFIDTFVCIMNFGKRNQIEILTVGNLNKMHASGFLCCT